MTDRRIYLAGPYSHASAEVRQARYQALTAEADRLMARRHHVFSPITHGHPIASSGGLPGDWEYWAEFSRGMIVDWADAVAVFMLSGWRESVGVTAEIKLATAIGKPVHFLNPSGEGTP